MLSSNLLSTAGILLPGLLAKGLVILLVLAIAASQLRRASAAVRHATWTAGIVSLLALPIALELGPRVHVASLVQGFSQSFSSLSDVARAPLGGAGNQARPALPISAHDILDGASSVAASAPRRSINVAVLLFVVWVIGALVLTARDIGRSARARRLISRSRVVRNASVLRVAAELRNRSGIDRPVLLVESDEILGPATFGIFRPVVLLPNDAYAWSPDTLHTVLAHEFGHVARRDCLTDAIALAARNIHWLNPTVWIAVRRMRLERERACDDRVLEMGVSPIPYATLLLNVARAALREPHAYQLSRTGALAMAAPSELESRLLAIFDPKLHRGSLRRGQRFAVAAIAATTSLLIAGLRLEAAPNTAVAIPDAGFGGQTSAAAGVAFRDSASRSEMLAPAGNTGTRTEGATPVTSTLQRGDTPPLPRVSEPDTRQDSVAHPRSERISTSRQTLADALRGYEASRYGPDSLLVHSLRAQLDRVSRWEGDLVSERSAWALARVRDGRIIEPMVDELTNTDWRARAYAAWTLSEAGASAMRDRRATGQLTSALTHPVWRLRAMATHALSAIGDPAARGAMLGVIDDEAWQVRLGAVDYIARLKDPTLLPIMERLTRDTHIAVRGAATEALATNRTRNSSSRN